MKRYLKNQIVIIGAGPAGITTALYLAKKQIHTILLDKATFPRHKACADNITGGALRILNELDASWVQKLKIDELSLPIEGLTAYAPNCHSMEIDFLPLEKDTDQNSCYTIPRIDFDNFLIERAKENPYIKVIEDCNITTIERLKTGGVQLKDKSEDLVIDADLVVFSTGSNSNLVNSLHPIKKGSRHVAVGVRAYFKGVKPYDKPGFCEIFITKKLVPGAIYITPFPNGTVNVNAVMISNVVKKKNINLTALMMETLKEHPVLKERFENAVMIGKPHGSNLFLGTKKRKLSGDNFMLVGDAAGLIDLLSANGIPQAMISAKIAAEEIVKCLEVNKFSAATLKAYDQRVHKRLENYLKMSRLVAPFVSNPIFLRLIIVSMNFVVKKFKKNDELRDLMYEKHLIKRIIKPSFYYRLIFGIKNTEALGN